MKKNSLKLKPPHDEEVLDSPEDRVRNAISGALCFLEDQEGKIWDPREINRRTDVIMERISTVIDFSSEEGM